MAVPSWLWGVLVVGGVGTAGYLAWRASSSPSPKPGPKGLINKGHSALFELTDGRDVSAPGGMMHDPSGKAWPARSVLFGPFRRGSEGEAMSVDARRYLGSTHSARRGQVKRPPRALRSWTYVGDVERIFYTRTGQKQPGRYQHPFNEGLLAAIKGHRRVRLYRRGRYYRLELPPGALLDARGYVWP